MQGGFIKVVDGDFPKQTATAIGKSKFNLYPKLVIRSVSKQTLAYPIRSSIRAMETVIEHKKTPTIKLTFDDGKMLIGKADVSAVELIKVQMALGPDTEEKPETDVETIRVDAGSGAARYNVRAAYNSPVNPPSNAWSNTAAAVHKLSPKAKITKAVESSLKFVIVIMSIILIGLFITPLFSSEANRKADSVKAVLPDQAERQWNETQQADAKAAQATLVMNAVNVSSDLLTGAELDLKNGNLADIDMVGIGATLEVIYSTVSSLQTAWNSRADLSKSDMDRLKAIEVRLVAFQRQALPKMRLAFKKQAGQVLWEHDVYVKVTGNSNTNIEFAGAYFAANANIKQVYTQLYDLMSRLRFKQLRFKWYQGADEFSYYALETPGDAVIAAYSGGSFQRFQH